MLLQKIKWDQVGWLNITDTVLSFPWPGLPADVHFSVSYHPNSNTINLHLTRNVPGVPENNKPKITIAQWQKAEMEEMLAIFWHRCWTQLWIPFDMRPYQFRRSGQGRSAKFISFTRLEKARDFSFLKKRLLDGFTMHMKRKRGGKELHIRDGMLSAYERLLQRPEVFWWMMNKFRRVPRQFSLEKEWGYLYAREVCGLVLNMHGQWFAFRENGNLAAALEEFFEPDVWQKLKDNTKTAIQLVNQSKTYEDTRPFNQPIDLLIIR